MPPAPGQRLSDNLVLERELGAGAMGSVWEARNVALGTPVAVKLLHRSAPLAGDADRRRFVQEARGLAQLDHPHIVRVFDFGTSPDGDPFIVMERLLGEDLDARLGREGRLAPHTVVEIVSQVCKALARAEAAGVVHRDLKPANLFLLAGEDPFVKILDFGIARFTTASSLTAVGVVLGTPLYMSPEQFARGALDARADLWSLAVIAYQCLTGSLPFPGENVAAVTMAVFKGEFRVPSALVPGLPPALDAFMSRALQAEPAQRFASPRAFAEAFAACLAADGAGRAPSRDGLATAPTQLVTQAVGAAARRPGRSWILIAALVLAPLLAMGAGAGGYLLYARGDDPAPKRPARSSAAMSATGAPLAPPPASAAPPPALPIAPGARFTSYDPGASLATLKARLGGRLTVLDISFYPATIDVDVRSPTDSKRVDRYELSLGQWTGEDEPVSDEYTDTLQGPEPIGFDGDLLTTALLQRVASDALGAVKLTQPAVQAIFVDRDSDTRALELHVSVKDSEGRSGLIDYDAGGKLLRANVR